MGHLARLRTTVTRGCATVVLLGSSGCTFLTDVDLTPCDPDDEDPCPGGFICNAEEGICIGSECTSNAGCNSRNTNEALFACIEGACVQPKCEQDSDCQDQGGGFGNAICEQELCVPGQCERDAECKEELDTDDAVCTDGRCEDPIWGCIGRKDPREPEGDAATFKIEWLDAVNTTMHPPLVEATACFKNDHPCSNALQTKVTYDEDDGMLTVEGLPQDWGGYLLINGEHSGALNYMEGRYFFENRTVVNDFEAPGGAVMLPEEVVPTLAEGANADVKAERGILLGRVFNCQDELAEGVSLVVNDPSFPEDAIIFYTDEENQPNQDLSATTSAGTIGIANVLEDVENPDRVLDLQVWIGEHMITQANVIAQQNTLTHIFFYPGYE